MNLWESGIGFSGFVWGPFRSCFGGTLLLVDDGVPLEIAWGGLWGWARVADFALSGVIATCPFTIYHLLVNVLRFLVSGFYIYYVVLYILV